MPEQLATREPTEAQAKVARACEERLQTLIVQGRRLWIKIAEELYAFTSNEMWRDLGYHSLDAWLASPEVDISRRQSFYLTEAWRELVVKRGVDPEELGKVKVSKVQVVLPAIRRGFAEAEEALADCEVLTRPDLHERYDGVGAQGAAGPKATVNSDRLDAETEPEYAICPACGSRYRKQAA